MAVTIAKGPKPQRPNPLAGLGRGISQGLMAYTRQQREMDALQKKLDLQAKMKREQAQQEAEAYAPIINQRLGVNSQTVRPQAPSVNPPGGEPTANNPFQITTANPQGFAFGEQPMVSPVPEPSMNPLSPILGIQQQPITPSVTGAPGDIQQPSPAAGGSEDAGAPMATDDDIGRADQGLRHAPGQAAQAIRQLSPEQKKQFLTTWFAHGHSLGDLFEFLGGGEQAAPEPQTDLAKMTADYRNGLIDRDAYIQGRRKLLETDEPMVKVADPNNPNRSIYVPRSQAPGQFAPSNNANAVNVAIPNDQGGFDSYTGREMPDGTLQVRNANGDFVTAPRNAQIIGRSAQGSESDVLPSGEDTDLRDQEVATRRYVATSNDAIAMIKQHPDVNTWTGRTAATINNLQAEARAFSRATGVHLDPKALDPSHYDKTFDQLGIENNRMRSMITALAVQRAIANNPSGRVSDFDYRAAVREIGGSASDPRALAAVIRDNRDRMVRNFRISYQVRKGEPYQGDLGVPQSTQQSTQPSPQSATPQSNASKQGVPEGVPEGSRRVGHTSDGHAVFQTPDGQRVVVEP